MKLLHMASRTVLIIIGKDQINTQVNKEKTFVFSSISEHQLKCLMQLGMMHTVKSGSVYHFWIGTCILTEGELNIKAFFFFLHSFPFKLTKPFFRTGSRLEIIPSQLSKCLVMESNFRSDTFSFYQ